MKKRVCAALLAATLALGLLTGCGETTGRTPVVYLTLENELRLMKNLSADSESIQLADRAADPEVYQNDASFLNNRFQTGRSSTADGGILWSSADGKTLYFLARVGYDTATLYRTELSKLKAGSDKNDTYIEKLDSSILPGSVQATPAGLLYEKSGDSGRRLYYYNGQESIKLIEGSLQNSRLTADGAGIIYGLTGSEDGAMSLYYQPLASDGEKEKLATNVDFFNYTDGVLLYTKYQDGKCDVYTVAPGQESVKLVTDAEGIRSTWGKSFYYTAIQERQIPIASLVAGELTADVLNSHPYPKEEDFMLNIDSTSTDELSAAVGGSNTYDEWWDAEWWGIDGTEPFVANTNLSKYSDHNKTRYKSYLREHCGYTDTVKDFAAYNAAIDQYNEWITHYDTLYQEMQGTYTAQDTALYFYDGTEPRLICRSIGTDSVTTNARQQFALYQKLPGDAEIEKIKLENLTDISDVYNWYANARAATDANLRYYTIGSAAEGELAPEGEWLTPGLLNGGTELLLKLAENGELVSYPVQAGVLGKPISVAEDVAFYHVSEDKNTLYYYKDVSDGIGDLCRYQGGSAETLASDVSANDGSRTNCVYADGMTLALRDLGSSGGTLTLFRSEESVRVADDVTYYLRLSEQDILYLSDGNLYLYDGKEKQRLSNDVAMVWSPTLIAGIMV